VRLVKYCCVAEKISVGVVGIGFIGGGVSRALLRNGYRVIGFDVRPDAAAEAGVVPAAGVGEVADSTDLVLIAVFDDKQVRDVLGEIVAATPLPRAVCILSTVTPQTIRWAGEVASRHGLEVLDTGVTGGSTLQSEGHLAVMVGGDAETVEWARPALETFGVPTLHMGALGTGMNAKIARNMITYGSWFVALEAAQLARAGGVDLEKLIEICDASDPGTGGALGLLRRGVRAGAPADADDRNLRTLVLGYALKDLAAAFELGRELAIEPAVARVVARDFPGLLGLE
jgi:3-hydroxyisobutyrate dehydrogenase-like beta-hydroxyacid dehydrogenase